MSLIVNTFEKILAEIRTFEDFKQFKNMPEDDVIGFHHTVGRALRNGQVGCPSLWEDNDLTREFKEIGIWHADDMSWVFLVGVHRIINNRPVNLEEMRDHFHAHWRSFRVDPWTGEDLDTCRQCDKEALCLGA